MYRHSLEELKQSMNTVSTMATAGFRPIIRLGIFRLLGRTTAGLLLETLASEAAVQPVSSVALSNVLLSKHTGSVVRGIGDVRAEGDVVTCATSPHTAAGGLRVRCTFQRHFFRSVSVFSSFMSVINFSLFMWGAFSKESAKTTVGSVYLSVSMVQLGSQWTDFHDILEWGIILISVVQFQVFLKWDTKKRYFTWRPTYIHKFVLQLINKCNKYRLWSKYNLKPHGCNLHDSQLCQKYKRNHDT
jgi:hypothetical protein